MIRLFGFKKNNLRKMRFLLLLFCVFAFANASRAQGSLEFLDAKNGFRDARFGAMLSSFTGMKSSDANPYEKSDWKNYERSSDVKSLGDISLDYISYKFYKNYLIQISLQSKGDFEEIFSTITQAYGKHTSVKSSFYDKFEYFDYYWKSSKVTIIIIKGPEYTSLEFHTNTDNEYFDKLDNESKMQKRLKGL